MQRPPDKQTAPEASRGDGGSGSAKLKSKQLVSETPPAAQAIIDAAERAEDLLALWQEHRRLSYRVRLARLKFELIGLDPDEQNDIEAEVIAWKRLIEVFAHGEKSVEMPERWAA